jgi:hypothetical protein
MDDSVNFLKSDRHKVNSDVLMFNRFYTDVEAIVQVFSLSLLLAGEIWA